MVCFFFFTLFIYLILAALSLRCWAFSSSAQLQCGGFSLRWLLLLRSMGSRRAGFSSCGARASVVVAHGLQQLWRMGLFAPWHVGSSWTRDRTRVPCIGRRILNHCATREVPLLFLWLFLLSFLEPLLDRKSTRLNSSHT